MGLSQLQGSPYHVVQIKRRTDEDNDPFFTRKRKKTPFSMNPIIDHMIDNGVLL